AIAGWSRAKRVFPDDATLWQLFAEQARLRPDAVALVAGEQRMTYAELEARAGEVAGRLRSSGVRSGQLVGLCCPRTAELIVGLLGILRVGAAYVPLDPEQPAQRMGFMLADSAVNVVVTSGDVTLPEGGHVVLNLDQLGDAGDVSRAGESDFPAETPDANADDLAYLIYTSGSTGTPKAVMVSHRNVVRLLRSTEEWFSFSEADVWSMFHSAAFDFSVWEVWGALAYGGRLVVVPYWESRNPEAFYDLLATERVSVLNQTPAAFRQLVAVDAERSADLALRTVVFGGEALDTDSVLRWFDKHGEDEPRLVNMYGITETTVHVTYQVLSRAVLTRSSSPIGVPIPDLSVWVMDPYGRPAPIGVAGELWVGGAG
ncbi:MAG: AMP-binding protein, partial [Micromonosporaceae bacterium]